MRVPKSAKPARRPGSGTRLRLEPLESREVPAAIGTLDPSFGTGGKVALFPTASTISGVAVDVAGRTVLAGSIPGAGGFDILVVRLNADGSPDPTFGTGGKVTVDIAGGDDRGRGVATDAAGNVVVAGTTGTSLAFVRLKAADGSLDTGFGGGGTGTRVFTPSAGFNNIAANDVTVGPAGEIVATGNSLSAGLKNSLMVVKLTPDGSMVDPGFNGGAVKLIAFQFGVGSDTLGQSVVLSGSNIVIGGQTNNGAPGATNRFAATRLLGDGTFDPAFTGNLGSVTAVNLGAGTGDQAFGADVDAAGDIYLAGSSVLGATTKLGVAKLTPDGNPDATFGTAGVVLTAIGATSDEGDAIAVRPSGRVVVAGTSQETVTKFDFFALQLTPDGKLDTQFNAAGPTPGVNRFDFGTDAANFVGSMAVNSTGRVAIGGTDDTVGGLRAARLIGTVERPRDLSVGGSGGATAGVFAPTTDKKYTAPATSTTPASVFPGFTGEVRTATGDFNGDGFPDTVMVTGPGTKTVMAVVSGKDNSVLMGPTDPFGDANFTFGGFVTAGDLNGDGVSEWVVTPELQGGPRVVIFGLSGSTFRVVANFFGIGDPAFRDGDRAALGDVNNDGILDLFSTAAFNGGPRTALYDGKDVLVAMSLNRDPVKLIANDFFGTTTGTDDGRGGRGIAAGDVNGDGVADFIITGDNLLGTGNQVTVFSGADLIGGKLPGFGATPLANFTVGGQPGGSTVSVATVDPDGDNKADLVVGSGAGQAALIKAYYGKDLSGTAEPTNFTLTPFGGVATDGVFVG